MATNAIVPLASRAAAPKSATARRSSGTMCAMRGGRRWQSRLHPIGGCHSSRRKGATLRTSRRSSGSARLRRRRELPLPGRQYRLRVATGEATDIRLGRTILTVTLPGPADPTATRAALDGWFATEARRIFAAWLAVCFQRMARLGVAYPTLTIRAMSIRWGSCSRASAITLNLRLIQAPQPCIDYVILHELCHLQEHHHGKAFYTLLDQTLPDWRDHRRRLK